MPVQNWLRIPKPKYLRQYQSPFAGLPNAPNRCYAVLCARRSVVHGRFTLPSSFLKSRTFPTLRNTQLATLSTSRSAAFATRASQSEYAAIKDDTHPSLFYHIFNDEELSPVFSLSFLEERPQSARSKTVLGWLPALSPEDSESNGNGLNDFVPNSEFLPILHKTVKEALLDDEVWTNSAIQTQSGWMHIFDQRNPPPLGRISEPDDILASVRVEDGRMLIDTYEPMPSYRLCTADGVCQLTETLLERLRTELKRVAEAEWQNH